NADSAVRVTFQFIQADLNTTRRIRFKSWDQYTHGTNIRSPLRVGIAEPQCTTRTRDKWPSARKPIRSVAISVVKPVLSHFFKVAVLGKYPVSFLQQQVWEECKQTSQNTDRRFTQLVNCMQKAVSPLLGGCTA